MKHGSTAAYYTAKCRCDICRTAQFRRAKEYKRRQRLDPMVEAAPALARVDKWVAEGFPRKLVWSTAGLIKQHKTPRRLHASAVHKLMTLTRQDLLTNAAPNAVVPSIGAQRRVRALQAMGWPVTAMPISANTAYGLLRKDTVFASVHRAVASFYDQLSMIPGPSNRSRVIFGSYPPPLAWDDDAIDDPAARPESIRTAGTARRDQITERREAIAALTESGLSAAAIADRLGVTGRTVTRARSVA